MQNNAIIFDFLTQLVQNNNRDWFKSHREMYDSAWKQFNNILSELLAEISKFDESVANLTPQDCTYRIYRDLRFSQDKTPYKGHFGAYINQYGKKAYWGGYYLQIEPDKVMLASGVWYLPTKEMAALRCAIADQMSDFESIVENPKFKKLVPVIGQEHYKKLPAGLPKDSPHHEYLMCKDYTVSCNFTPEILLRDDCAAKLAEKFKIMRPFNDFLSSNILINMEEQETLKNIVKIF